MASVSTGADGFVHAFLLHSRPYRETSLIADFLTAEQGRVSAVVRGARNSRASSRSNLQPFAPLLLSLRGRGELLSLTQVELVSPPLMLVERSLFSALYLNELVVRLLPRDEVHAEVFLEYGRALEVLAARDEVLLEPALRRFEQCLLSARGMDYLFQVDCETGDEIVAEQFYRLFPARGFVLSTGRRGENVWSGELIAAVAARDYADESVRLAAKRIFRELIHVQLGGKPLRSRELFRTSR